MEGAVTTAVPCLSFSRLPWIEEADRVLLHFMRGAEAVGKVPG